MKYCGSCGSSAPQGARFCPKCGGSLAAPAEAAAPPASSPALPLTSSPGASPTLDPRQAHEPSGQMPRATPRSGSGRGVSRRVIVSAAAAAVLIVVGFGGAFAWSATEVKRKCALQGSDVGTVLVPWPVKSVSVSYGTEEYPFVNCFYSSGEAGTLQDAVSVTQDSTEAGEIPGKPESCLTGGYWQGRGYVCVAFGASPVGLEEAQKRSVIVSGTRLNGSESFSSTLTCVEDADGAQPPTRELQERCFSELVHLMGALIARLDATPEATAPQTTPSLDAALVAAQLDATPDAEATPTSTDPEPTGEPSTPDPAASDFPSSPSSPSDMGVDVVGDASFAHFEVSVSGTESTSGDETLVHARVCLTSLTADASNGTTRISWEPWSATTSTGLVLRPQSATGVATAFPRESRVAPGECVSGDLLFNAPDIVSVTYKNGQGDHVTFP